ncbi:Zn-ribbon domain-containing OB-fold protein [Ramlibacter humi]|uniref:DNA-binding protein n=1 Tax=Ramlibacter humi TaxID=2530451 RepID=A0A4Z0BD07_9BURK|nr:OB-fold domain-containing protein [Ramlibacter humi]TFY97176.1 hypothetical protein EZ216_19035 [Ramlibacter humi]
MSDHLPGAGVLERDPYAAAFPEHLPFWQAAAEGRLLLPRCADCGWTHWHPRAHCPFCWSGTVRWEVACARARLHTFTVIPRNGSSTVLAYVRLEEGPLMLTNVVDADPGALRIGMPLVAAFRATPEGRMAPVFRPAPE